MASTVLDSEIFGDIFGSAEMRAVFSDANTIACYVRAEVALAIAQGKVGVMPREQAGAIAAPAPQVVLDRAGAEGSRNVGYPILSLVRQLSAALGEASRYVHWGRDDAGHYGHRGRAAGARRTCARRARSRRGCNGLQALAVKASRHRDGRPHPSAAGLPIAHFGYKARSWLSMVERHLIG